MPPLANDHEAPELPVPNAWELIKPGPVPVLVALVSTLPKPVLPEITAQYSVLASKVGPLVAEKVTWPVVELVEKTRPVSAPGFALTLEKIRTLAVPGSLAITKVTLSIVVWVLSVENGAATQLLGEKAGPIK